MKSLLVGILSLLFIGSFGLNISYAAEDVPSPAPSTPTDTPTDTPESVGIKDPCLMGMGKGCFDYEMAVGIKDAQTQKKSATIIVQDIIFAATYMVGTVLTLVIICCGLGYIFASKDGESSKASKYKDGLIYAAIGAILVWGAYGIVRLIQYIANG